MKIFSILLLIVCGIMFVQTFKFADLSLSGMGPEVFPRIILILAMILGLILLYQSFKGDENVEKIKMNKRQLLVSLSIVLYIILLKPLGFIVSSSIFMIICMFAIKPLKDIKYMISVLGTTAVVVAGVYYIFAIQLKLFLP